VCVCVCVGLLQEMLKEEYGVALLDGHEWEVGNFLLEPPGLFRGRGEHPKMGALKKRLQPEDISINIGDISKAPVAPPGHKWKEVKSDNSVTWMASWTENVHHVQRRVVPGGPKYGVVRDRPGSQEGD
jgi:DNA topoisomerase-1